MSGPSLEKPGKCTSCGAARLAVVAIDGGGDTRPTVACLRCSRLPPRDHAFAVSMDEVGQFRVHQAGGPVFENCIRAIGHAGGLLSRALRHRADTAARKVLGPWHVVVDGDGTFAPRPFGKVRGQPWPLRPGVLRRSRWPRACVECASGLAADTRVFRADPKAYDPGERGRLGWSSSEVRDCIVCTSCVEKARERSRSAAQLADGILDELLGAYS